VVIDLQGYFSSASPNQGARNLFLGTRAGNPAPELVEYDAEGRPLAVRYHFVNAMLLNELQKQQARIEALEARLARLEQAAANRP
jgi:hypothetical protein